MLVFLVRLVGCKPFLFFCCNRRSAPKFGRHFTIILASSRPTASFATSKNASEWPGDSSIRLDIFFPQKQFAIYFIFHYFKGQYFQICKRNLWTVRNRAIAEVSATNLFTHFPASGLVCIVLV